jgi:hypothetical protein
MSLVSDAQYMFYRMWEFIQKFPNINRETNSEIRAQLFGSWIRLLESIHFFLTSLIKASSLLAKNQTGQSKKIRQHGNRELKKILRVVTNARKTYRFFDVLQSLYLFLELYEGQQAYGRGEKSYKRILKKWSDKKYDSLKIF